jgi:hypothetical protein
LFGRPTGLSFQLLTARVAPDGSFEFLQVRPGNYWIDVDQAPGTPSMDVTVAGTDISGIEIAVAPVFAVTGILSVEGGRARPDVTVKFDGDDYNAETEVKDGKFTELLPPGEYRVQVTGVPTGYYLQSIVAGSRDLTANPLKITASDAANITMTLGVSSGVTVSGRIKPYEDTPQSPQRVILARRAGRERFEASIKPDGSFEFPKVMPGAYNARVVMTRNVWSPPTPLTVPTKDLRDLEITIPASVKISGRVVVDGDGPAPKFALSLTHVSSSQVIQLEINALSDGTFSVTLPEGAYRLKTDASDEKRIPKAYLLRSLTYGRNDLLKESFVVSDKEHAEIQVGFGTTAPNPWVKISGRVKGIDPADGPFRVTADGNDTAAVETFVNPDGTFEFPHVLRNTRYSVQLLPENKAASVARVAVADKDVSDVQIVVPPSSETAGHVKVDGDAPIPGFVLSLATREKDEFGRIAAMHVAIKPDANGDFKAKLPSDERLVSIGELPFGYLVKSLNYGAVDLKKDPLKITDRKMDDLNVTLTLDDSIPFGRLSGRIKGLDRTEGAVRIELTGLTTLSSFDTAVDLAGSFDFGKVPQGAYLATLIAAGVSKPLAPLSVVVSGSELARVELALEESRPMSRPADEPLSGVTLNEVGAGSATDEESGAIAELRTINTALITYLSSNQGKYGDIPALIDAGLLDTRFTGPMSGYSFSIIAIGSDYAAAATPVSPNTGHYGFYSTPDAVIRYSTADVLSPAGRNGTPVN